MATHNPADYCKASLRPPLGSSRLVLATLLIGTLSPVFADGDVGGFIENSTHVRDGVGLTQFRNTVQIEGSKDLGQKGIFSNVSVHGTFRGTYEGVYDLNEEEFGEDAGGPRQFESVGVPADVLGPGAPAFPASYTDWGASPVSTGFPVVGGSSNFGFNATDPNAPNYNPNEGLVVLGENLHDPEGGVTLGVPVRPCDVDSRGCIDDYLDFETNDLRFPEFNERADFIREAYVDATMPAGDGAEMNFRVGRQQVVWGRTDLFRVLDVLNPVDYSRHNIYDELEDIRMPMWMATAEYRAGPTQSFDDLNFQLVWNFDKFRPSNLGQGGTPYSILDAGSFFRAMKNCWDNGCSVSNFAGGGLATDFPAHTIGIRDVHLPDWSLANTQVGAKIEGVYKSVGFSVNALNFRSQLPSLRAGNVPAVNPFLPVGAAFPPTGEVGGEELERDYLIAFDMYFPRINLVGGSLDFYSDKLKSVFRLEGAYTTGEEFANTLRPELYSDSDVFRWVLGVDRNTFIPFLNERRAFLISGQIFGQHLLDHERETSGNGVDAGIPDWKDNYIATLLLKGWYKSDRLSPQIIFAHDFKAEATTIAPSLDWLISDRWRLVMGANIKTGKGAREFDDCRTCNPFPPFTAGGGNVNPGDLALRLSGLEPLGRFQSGPLGMAQNEDEFNISIRYRF